MKTKKTHTVYNPYNCEQYYCGAPPTPKDYARMRHYLSNTRLQKTNTK